MEISDIVSIVITAATRTPSQAGFGVPMILGYSASFTDLIRTYSKLTDVAVDFATTTPEYKAAARFFSQSPSPRQIKIARGTHKPTQQFEFTPVVINSYVYKFTANGLPVSFTSDGTATAAEITAGLKTAFDLLSLAYTSSQQSTNTVLRLLGDTAGNWLDILSNDPNLPVLQDHADPGIATDLDAILTVDSSWYALVTCFNSKLMIDAAGAWAESNKKLYLAQTQDSAVRDTPKSGTDDVGESTQNAALTHTSVWFSVATSDFLDAGVEGALLPYDPGSETWAFKQINSVPAGAYTPSQRANMAAKNVNFYEPTAGLNITWQGKVASGEFIDVVRFLDWLEARLGESIFGTLASAKKVPYTGKGIEVIGNAVRAVLKQASKPPIEGISPDFEVLTPAIADVPSADKSTRTLNNVTFSATLTGAIHMVNLQGTVSV